MFVSLRPLVFVSASLLGGCHLTGDTGVGVGKLDDGGGGGGGSEDGTTSASCSPFDTAGWDILIGLDSSVSDAAPPDPDLALAGGGDPAHHRRDVQLRHG
jgi:hypothetical protein